MHYNPIIVALDYNNLSDAISLVDTIEDKIDYYKVGLEIFLQTKGEIITELKNRNKKIFLDLKFHDISNTVLKACEFALSLDIDLFNIHTSNGLKTMQLVAQLLQESKTQTQCVGVTILTSLLLEDINRLYNTNYTSVDNLILHLAQMTHYAGLNGVVCSPLEAQLIKKNTAQNFTTICPGIRPNFSETNDQKRTLTPSAALQNGVDYMVIGRPITQHQDPKNAVQLILNSLDV